MSTHKRNIENTPKNKVTFMPACYSVLSHVISALLFSGEK